MKLDHLMKKAKQDNIYRFCVGAVILNAEGKLLLCKRSMSKKIAPGHWHIAGGGVDTGETIKEALRRELQEELALELVSIEGDTGMSHEYPSPEGMHRTVFILAQVRGTIKLNEENDMYAFVAYEALADYVSPRLLTSHQEIVKHALDKAIFSKDVI